MEFEPKNPEILPASFETCVSFIQRVQAKAIDDGYDETDHAYMRIYDEVGNPEVSALTVGFIPNEIAGDGSIDYFIIKTEKISNQQYGTFSIDTEYCVNAFPIDESFVVMSALLDISSERTDMPEVSQAPQSVELLEMLDRFYELSTDEQSQELVNELRSLSRDEQLALQKFLIELFPPTDDIPMTESDLREAISLLDTLRETN